MDVKYIEYTSRFKIPSVKLVEGIHGQSQSRKKLEFRGDLQKKLIILDHLPI